MKFYSEFEFDRMCVKARVSLFGLRHVACESLVDCRLQGIVGRTATICRGHGLFPLHCDTSEGKEWCAATVAVFGVTLGHSPPVTLLHEFESSLSALLFWQALPGVEEPEQEAGL